MIQKIPARFHGALLFGSGRVVEFFLRAHLGPCQNSYGAPPSTNSSLPIRSEVFESISSASQKYFRKARGINTRCSSVPSYNVYNLHRTCSWYRSYAPISLGSYPIETTAIKTNYNSGIYWTIYLYDMDVNDVLQNISDRQKKASALTDIDRPLILDTGTLAAWDPDSIVMPKAGEKREEYFRQLARDNVQVILNRLYAMEDTDVIDGERVLRLPEPTTLLPRAKPIPKPKPPTKWEQFAKRKGIQSHSGNKREKKVWDETTKRWVSRYGYDRTKNEEQKDWLIEVPDNADPNTDFFAKKREEKKERVAKNRFQQYRNKLKQ